jgi:hypothetical protein
MSGDALFPIDVSLLARASEALGPRRRTWFVVGGAGTGKTTVCAEVSHRAGIPVLDMDARIYGSWHGSFDPLRHPASHAWSTAPDPLAWQLALDPDAFVAFHAAEAAEALDLLVDELGAIEPGAPLLVDGGFGRPLVLAEAVPPTRIACLSIPARLRQAVWTVAPERRGFLDVIASVSTVAGPVEAFLALGERLDEEILRDAGLTGITVLERDEDTTVAMLAARLTAALGIAGR